MKFRNLFLIASLALLPLAATAQRPRTQQAPPIKDEGKLTTAQRQEVIEQLNAIIKNQAFVPGVDFAKWPEYLEAQKESLDKAESPRAFAMAVNRALNKFGASHIVFSTPESAAFQRDKVYTGLGIMPFPTKDGVLIQYVYSGSAAEAAGLVSGDIIVEVNGKAERIQEALRGEEGTEVKLKVKKAASGTVVEITATRKVFSTVIQERLDWISADTAILKIPSFMTYNAKKVQGLVQEAKDKNAKTIAVDLRNNGGGYVFALSHLMGTLIPNNPRVGTFIDRKAVDKYVAQKKGKPTDYELIAEFGSPVTGAKVTNFKPYEGNLVVLINGGTGSASEMFAAAARDATGAKVIGAKSAGAVLASLMMPLKHGFQLQYPFQDYVTIKGVRLEGNGVAPDVSIGNTGMFDQNDVAVGKILEIATKAAEAGK